IWYDTARELHTALHQLHAFRRTRFLGLNSDAEAGPDGGADGSELWLTTEPFRLHAPTVSPAAAVGAGERSLVVVLTDGVGRAWHSGAAHRLLRSWARRGPVAVWHLLPETLWPETALAADRRTTTAPHPGAANHKLAVHPSRARTRHDPAPHLPLPVVDINTGTATAAWARLIGAPSGEVVLPLTDADPLPTGGGDGASVGVGAGGAEWAADPPAAEVLDDFLSSATPTARRLAAHLACVPPITVPLMRLVQQSAAPGEALSHLAEVFLSGLLQRTTADGAGVPPAEETPWGQRYYAFLPEVVDPLRELITRSAERGTSALVTRHLQRLNDSRNAALALISDPAGAAAHTPGADELARSETTPDPAPPFRPDPDPAPELDAGPGSGPDPEADPGPDADPPGAGADDTVPLGFVLGIALGKGLRAPAAAELLGRSGYPAPDPATLPDLAPDPVDLTLLSRNLDATSWADLDHPWFGPGEPVPVGHVLAAGATVEWSARAVAERLAAWGHPVPYRAQLPDVRLAEDDRTLASRDLDGVRPWLDPAEPVQLGHLLAATIATDHSARSVAERLAAWGYRVPDPARLPDLRPDETDRILLSRDLDGVGPWLDPGEPVPVGHLLAAGAAVEWPARVVAARLRALGYPGPDPATLPDLRPEDGDRTLLSRRYHGGRPWLDPAEPVPEGHLLVAAVVADRSARSVAERLAALGYRVPDPAALPDLRTEDGDRTLVSRDLDGVGPWLDPVEPVTSAHVLAAAIATGRSAAAAAERLTALGYRVPGPTGWADRAVEENDRVLISRDLDGISPWISRTEQVEPAHVLAAAVATGRSARAVAARLRALGYPAPDQAGFPDDPPPFTDRILVSQDLDGMSPWLDPVEPLDSGHLLAAAIVTERPARAVAERLRALGYRVPDPADLPDLRPEEHDLELIGRSTDEVGPWDDPVEPVEVAYVLETSLATGRPAADVARRLAELGYQVPARAQWPDPLTEDGDRTLLSRRLDGEAPWLDAAEPVPLGHLLAAAATSALPPATVAAHLAELGYQVPDQAWLADLGTEDGDLVLLSQDLDGTNPWLRRAEAVTVAHVLAAAAATERSARAVAERLDALGFPAPGRMHWPDLLPEADDRTLISRDLDALAPWLDQAEPVTVAHVLAAARTTGRSARAVAERLQLLGYDTPALAILPDAPAEDDGPG
ncbi:SAV_2336 N-terminal domain-related protein, partial [Kitasatospora phosalacinea]|uniref:wHTH domain-containing protein n=1 Tax=Kitasatospora phosalacinea TaxID=2065 RepID=UPI0035D794FB